ncbi:putative capsular polysaccharide synthesis family protein [Celeribacter sp.]|uniref:putative capsular polysaccharide synthesis family protein n=1 Tax=Celeribacter sp. TaxID=1890673 RepID=UPI003A8D3D9F
MSENLRKQYGFLKKLSVWFGGRSVIVLTMGKVGTLTICNSLDRIGFKHAHPHSLYYTRPGVHFLNIKLTPAQTVWYAYKTFTKRLKVRIWSLLSNEIIIITGARDPFSRAISAYFEQSHYFGGIPKHWDFDEIREDFEKRAFLDATVSWFDKEIKQFSGIDVIGSDFPKELGYKTYQNGKLRLFVYRIDRLNDLGAQIGKFLGVPDFSICPANETSDSLNAEIYADFAKRYKFNRETAQNLTESNYIRTFYSDAEIAALLERWVDQNGEREARR